jgi:pilus assembly protein CpaB
MKPKTLVLMGVAIACGLGASYMTSRLLAERNSDDEPKISVLVAKKNLNFGDTVRVPEELFQEKKFTRGEEPPGAIEKLEELKNRILKRPLRPGDHVTQEDLIGDGDGNQMNVFLPKDHRAVGVRVNVETGAFGFACAPLSRVDVIGTFRRGDDKSTFSRVLLENVLVLAADDKTKRDENGKPMPSQVVTLALKAEDALKVRLAGEMGTLSLMLRKINETGRVGSPNLTFEQLKKGEEPTHEDVEATVAKADPKAEPGEAPAAPKPEVTAPKPEVVSPKPEVVSPKPEVVSPKPEVVVSPKPAVPPTVFVTPKDKDTPKIVTKPESTEPPVVEVKQPAGKIYKMAIHEGGRTRYVEFLVNDNYEVIESDSPAEAAHPPRPVEAVEPKR